MQSKGKYPFAVSRPKQNKNRINAKLTSEKSSQITIAAVGKTADAFKDKYLIFDTQ